MFGFITVLHILICVLLGLVILMQSGRGGGLTENFAAAESMFGAQTNTFLVKTTTVFGVVFLVTCLSLAAMSSRREESLMSRKVAAPLADTKLPMSAADVQSTANELKQTVTEEVNKIADEAVLNLPEVPVIPSAASTP
jgi:preprotein translocase subunit SecG